MGPGSPWVELDGLKSYAFGTQGRFDDLDHLNVPGSDQNVSKDRWGDQGRQHRRK
jgi:hypothetical protein